jgi:hypothetical protein
MSCRRVVIILALAAWVVLGPVGMSSGGRALMGMTCEAPCGGTVCVVFAPAPSILVTAAAAPMFQAGVTLPASVVRALDHPPRPLSLSA